MIPQSFQDNGTTLNISPPNVTIRLPYDNEQGHHQETLAPFQVGECRAAFHKRFCIEHIPELKHHEETEEPRSVVRRQSVLCMEVKQQSHQNDYKCETDTENIVSHRAGNDKVAVLTAPARFVFHHPFVRW